MSNEITGEWKKLHNAELHASYSSPSIIRNLKSRRLRWAVQVARMEQAKNAYRVFVGKSEGEKRSGGRRRKHDSNNAYEKDGFDAGDWVDVLKIGTIGGLI